MKRLVKTFSLFLVFIFLLSCGEDFTPKPKGYPRIDLPEKSYKLFSSDCPFTFEHHEKSIVSNAKQKLYPCWLNIDYPRLQCRIHLSYRKIDNDLAQLMEESRGLVYKHTIKASAINQKDLIDEEKNLYAKIYEIEGDAASSVQFFATDSLNHFLRGALYFNAASNADSLQPAIDYVREDIENLVSSIQWK